MKFFKDTLGKILIKGGQVIQYDAKTEEEKSVTITENGTTEINASSGKVMTKVTANVNVPEKTLEEQTVTKTENGTYEILPSQGHDGISKVNLTVNVGGELEDYFSFTATECDSSCKFAKVGSFTLPILEFKMDSNGTWTSYTFGTEITVAKGHTVYFRGDNATFSISTSNYVQFVSEHGRVAGNIMSLIDKTMTSTRIANNYQFYRLFYKAIALIDIRLPATTLKYNCYEEMFRECINLINMPELPATSLSVSCYKGMFQSCVNLLHCDELPATRCENSCYDFMFKGCTSLKIAPKIKATYIDEVFALRYMFQGCTKLKEIEVKFTAFVDDSRTLYWLDGTSAIGTFKCPTALGTNETIARDPSYCPTGWTIVNTD